MPKIAVVLSGCGYLDGAEITEAVSTLLALSQQGAEAVCFAPDVDQYHVVNHVSGEETREKRNVLIEAARIARGKIHDIREAKVEELDAVIFPGGFGAAKNLCSFALDGPECKIHPDVAEFFKKVSEAGRPIGAICISPALIAKLLEGDLTKLTIGNDGGTAEALRKLGHDHVECEVDQICVDSEKKIVTAPAYMYDATPADVFSGIEKLVKEVLKLSQS